MKFSLYTFFIKFFHFLLYMVSMYFLLCSLIMAQEPNGTFLQTIRIRSDIEDKEESSVSYEDEEGLKDESQSSYPIRIINGAKWLNMSEDFVYMCWEIMEGLYIRDYKKLDASIEKAENLFPNTGVGPTGTVLKWQMKMLKILILLMKISIEMLIKLQCMDWKWPWKKKVMNLGSVF